MGPERRDVAADWRVRAPDRRFMASRTDIHMRFADVDLMQVVHHAAYIHWFEEIRFNFLDKVLGLGFGDFGRYRIATPVVACSINYLRSLRFGDRPKGYARLGVFKKAMFALHYEITEGETDTICATGVTTHCFVDADAKLLLRTPRFLADALAVALAKHPDCAIFHEDGEGSRDGR